MEDQATSDACLEVLPRSIGDTHKHLLQVIEKVYVLQDFLLGSQVRDCAPEAQKEPMDGIVNGCFNNLAKVSNSIEKCHDQLKSLITKLGVSEEPSLDRKGSL